MPICPDCDHEFALTFKRYFNAGSGSYTCPECRADCRLQLPGWLSFVERCTLIPGVIGCAVIGVVTHFWFGVLLTLLWLGINIPLNVVLDGRFGWLDLVRSRMPVEPTPPPLPTQSPQDENQPVAQEND